MFKKFKTRKEFEEFESTTDFEFFLWPANYIPEKEDIDGDEYSNIIEITEFGSIEEINYEIFRIYRK